MLWHLSSRWEVSLSPRIYSLVKRCNPVEKQSQGIVLFGLVHKYRYGSVPQMKVIQFTYQEYIALAREDTVLFCMKFQPYLHSRVELA